MERIVIAAYRPHAGKHEALAQLMEKHWRILDGEGLVSSRRPVIMQSADGTFVEVFGWKSEEAIEEAHANPVVQQMWQDYAAVAEYIPVGEVEEAKSLFSEFTPRN